MLARVTGQGEGTGEVAWHSLSGEGVFGTERQPAVRGDRAPVLRGSTLGLWMCSLPLTIYTHTDGLG